MPSRDELILLGISEALKPGSAWVGGRVGSRSEVMHALARIVRAVYAKEAEGG